MALSFFGILVIVLVLGLVVFGISGAARSFRGFRFGHTTLSCPHCGVETPANVESCKHCGNDL